MFVVKTVEVGRKDVEVYFHFVAFVHILPAVNVKTGRIVKIAASLSNGKTAAITTVSLSIKQLRSIKNRNELLTCPSGFKIFLPLSLT